MKNRNKKVLDDFITYCESHPNERFWQALRNWSGYDFIMGWYADEFDFNKAREMGLEDTFYHEAKRT